MNGHWGKIEWRGRSIHLSLSLSLSRNVTRIASPSLSLSPHKKDGRAKRLIMHNNSVNGAQEKEGEKEAGREYKSQSPLAPYLTPFTHPTPRSEMGSLKLYCLWIQRRMRMRMRGESENSLFLGLALSGWREGMRRGNGGLTPELSLLPIQVNHHLDIWVCVATELEMRKRERRDEDLWS